MNKRLFWTICIVVLIFVGIVVWKSNASSTAIGQDEPTFPSDTSLKTVDGTTQHQTREEFFQSVLLKQLQTFQRHPGNITQFLNEFQTNCHVQDCKAALAEALAAYPDQKFAQLMQNLLQRLPEYEKRMQSTILSMSLSPQERFDTLWKLREQTLGQAETILGFEEERHYANYHLAYAELKQNTNLEIKQRLEAFEKLQQQFPDVTQQESNMGRYEQALALLNDRQNSSIATGELKQMLQQRYLTVTEQKEIQLRDQREMKQQQQVNAYQQALGQLQQEMEPLKTQLSDAEWQKQYQTRLENLRLKMFP